MTMTGEVMVEASSAASWSALTRGLPGMARAYRPEYRAVAPVLQGE